MEGRVRRTPTPRRLLPPLFLDFAHLLDLPPFLPLSPSLPPSLPPTIAELEEYLKVDNMIKEIRAEKDREYESLNTMDKIQSELAKAIA